MKFYYAIILALAVSFSSYSQFSSRTREASKNTTQKKSVSNLKSTTSFIYYEDFQSQVMSSEMTIINDDDSPLPPAEAPNFTSAWIVGDEPSIDPDDYFALSTSYEATGTASDWMITPMISITTGAWLEWESMIMFGWGNSQEYEILVATSIAGSTPAPSDFTDPAIFSIIEEDDFFGIESVNLEEAGYSNTDIWVAFRNISAGSMDVYEIDILMIDDIKVHTPTPIDAEIISINTPHINNLSLDIDGTVKNAGTEIITSFDVSYNINDGTESAVFAVSGLNLGINETYDFTHDASYTFSETGDYTIEVNISNVNTSGETITTNNTLEKTIIIGQDNTLNKTILFEYLGSNDQPIGGGLMDIYATGQSTIKSEIIDNASNYSKSTLISYELDPDPYAIQECIDRKEYYTSTSNPDNFTNGNNADGYNDMYMNIDNLFEQPAFFNIRPLYTLEGNILTVWVIIDPLATINAKCHIAVVEQTTTGNLGACAATEYYHVLMKMLPDANGTEVNLQDGINSYYSLTYDLSSTNIEDINDIKVIAFLQDEETKYVYQSAYATVGVGIDNKSISNLNIYPNPCNGILNIENSKNSTISIYNIIGEEIHKTNNSSENTTIDMSNFPNGNYIIKVADNNNVVTKTINVTK